MNASYSSLSRGTAGFRAAPGVGPLVGKAPVKWPVSLKGGFKRKKTKPRTSYVIVMACVPASIPCLTSCLFKGWVVNLERSSVSVSAVLCFIRDRGEVFGADTVYIPRRGGCRS